MYKIAISGNLNSGKDTFCNLLLENLNKNISYRKLAFANPCKKIVENMFPELPKEYLYGDSHLRNELILNAKKDNKCLTVRELLLDISENYKKYNSNIWVNALEFAFNLI